MHAQYINCGGEQSVSAAALRNHSPVRTHLHWDMAKLLPFLRQGTIYIRITQDGERAEISTSLSVDASKWDSERKRMKGNSSAAESVNRRIESVVTRLRDIETDLTRRGVSISAKIIKEIYEGKGSEKRGLLQVFEQYITALEAKPESVRLSERTLDRYRLRLRNTAEYVRGTGRKDVPLEEVDDDFLQAFKAHMMNVLRWGIGHTAKHLESVKVVMRYAQQKKYTTVNYVAASKVDRENYAGRQIVFLPADQLHALEAHRFEGTLQQVADCAIVQAHTGLAYQELYDLSPEWITKGMDGGTWIQFYRMKTIRKKKYPVRVPLDDTVVRIISKYKDHTELTGRCLPAMSNAAYNRNLKIIAGILGLPAGLSSHHLRKTAGMLWLNGGVPIDTVAALLGDTVEVTKTHYARVIEEKISRDMEAFNQRKTK